MKRIISLLFFIVVVNAFCRPVAVSQNEPTLKLVGKVFDSTIGSKIIKASVYIIDSTGCVVDSSLTGRTVMIKDGKPSPLSDYKLYVPRKPAKYTIQVDYEGYDSGFLPVDITSVGHREVERELPDIFLRRTPRQLGEVTVTATKVKFYNKGDTLVYNADAFQLADGSMLDALIRQLPGVELRDNGQIYVNGRLVESLMLNGRYFMTDDNRLLLDNLGAYLVKDVAVYEKMGNRSEFVGRKTGDERYVMDVRIKKEFMGSYVANLEAGYGTANRYLGRFFLSRFDDNTQFIVYGNINNLNDSRKPGQRDSWRPETMQSGRLREKIIGGEYSLNGQLGKQWELNGNLNIRHNSLDDQTAIDRTNFLPGRETFGYQFNREKSRNLSMSTFHSFRSTSKRVNFISHVKGGYSSYDSRRGVTSATFNSRQQDVTQQWLQNIYSTSTSASLGDIINHNLQADSTKLTNWYAGGSITSSIKFSQNNDVLLFGIDANYREQKENRYNDQILRFGGNGDGRHFSQYYKNYPRRHLTLRGVAQYSYYFVGGGYIQPVYNFTFESKRKDSELYYLDRLADNGVAGTIDVDTEGMMFDTGNSFYGLNKTANHLIGFRSSYSFDFDNSNLLIMLGPSLNIYDQKLDYTQAGMTFRKSRTSVGYTDGWTKVCFGFGETRNEWGGTDDRNLFTLRFSASVRLPELEHLVDLPNTSDPLNILRGAENLKNEHTLNWRLRWELKPGRSRIMESVDVDYRLLTNALVRGYSYNTSTGVRTIRTYNTSGNWDFGLANNISLPVTRSRSVTLSSVTRLRYGHATDVIGIDIDEPEPFTVKNLITGENLKLSWNVCKMLNLGATADLEWRNTTSQRDDFNDIHALTANYGITGLLKLPCNLSFSTDLTLFTRRGYDSPMLNTTDLVWNARLVYSLQKGRWNLMLDGFDLLHQLSSVKYAVNAQGRTITYTNVLPRYFMLHVQYNINITPNRRK